MFWENLSNLSTHTKTKKRNLFVLAKLLDNDISMENAYELLIKESHLDTFGHVNNATYLNLYEEARWELISGRGYDLAKIQAIKQGPVILDVHLKFQKELTLREKVKITTMLLEYKGKVGKLEQKIIKADGSIASTAVFSFGLFDLKNRKLIEPTAEWKYAVGFKD